ncbi:hypothetical protein BH23CHL1_BH23CHL1_25270 [soil metagenome]
MKTTLTAYRSAVGIVLATALILMVPLLAMQFSDEVVWTLSDFIVVGTLLLGTGLTYELITRKVGSTHRLAVGLALAAALFLVWAELAVGIFGTAVARS